MKKFENLKELANIGRLLGEKNRLKILLLLKSGELNSSTIHKGLRLPQNLISNHLQILLKNKLIKLRKQSRFCYYSLNRQEIINRLDDLKRPF